MVERQKAASFTIDQILAKLLGGPRSLTLAGGETGRWIAWFLSRRPPIHRQPQITLA
jgi:hypothetical protein